MQDADVDHSWSSAEFQLFVELEYQQGAWNNKSKHSEEFLMFSSKNQYEIQALQVQHGRNDQGMKLHFHYRFGKSMSDQRTLGEDP